MAHSLHTIPQAPRPGQAVLYLPDLIVAGDEFSLGPHNAPLPLQEWHEFPFPRLFTDSDSHSGSQSNSGSHSAFERLKFPLPIDLVCKRLVGADIRTGVAFTETAAQIKNLPPSQRLHFVRRCRPLWVNLLRYCDPEGPGVATVMPPNTTLRHGIQPRTSTNSVPSALPFPDARQQATALDMLFGWYIVHNGRKPAVMTSEPSVQDEVHAQLIEPLNTLLQVWCCSLRIEWC